MAFLSADNIHLSKILPLDCQYSQVLNQSPGYSDCFLLMFSCTFLSLSLNLFSLISYRLHLSCTCLCHFHCRLIVFVNLKCLFCHCLSILSSHPILIIILPLLCLLPLGQLLKLSFSLMSSVLL